MYVHSLSCQQLIELMNLVKNNVISKHEVNHMKSAIPKL